VSLILLLVRKITTVAISIAWRDDHTSPRATCVILALILAFENSVPFRLHLVHETLSSLRNRLRD